MGNTLLKDIIAIDPAKGVINSTQTTFELGLLLLKGGKHNISSEQMHYARLDQEIVSLWHDGFTMTLERGMFDSIPASHYADTIVLFIDPQKEIMKMGDGNPNLKSSNAPTYGDSTKEPSFASGAKTSETKPKHFLIPHIASTREANAWTTGAEHYGYGNWENAEGDVEFFLERLAHLNEHMAIYNQYIVDSLAGKHPTPFSEDHLANMRCNIGMLMVLESTVDLETYGREHASKRK